MLVLGGVAIGCSGVIPVESRSEMTAMLDLPNGRELHSYMDLPERLRCSVSRMDRTCCLDMKRLTFGVADDG